MEITQVYDPEDQARIEKMHKLIEHHSELLIRDILQGRNISQWDSDCDKAYQADPIRALLIKKLCDIHSSIIPKIYFK